MDNLRKLREKKKLSQVRLSIEIEVSQELISQYELGKSRPNIDNLIKLADYFKCSTDYLLERTNNPDIAGDLPESIIEGREIIEKYETLSIEDKKHLKNFLEYLSNKN